MATARPVVSIYNFENASEKTGTAPMPEVLTSPLRPDLVRTVHMNVKRNTIQAHAVGDKVGYDTAAESWGTGRAVARIPRAPGGGTHRAGQATFGNQARGGGMFAPIKVWRRWHRRVNVKQKRHAVATSLAASSLPALVMARGHRIGQVAELPLVVSDGIQSITKTKQAVQCLKNLGCSEELQKVIDSKRIRAGKGKARNRRYRMRLGPLVIYNEDEGISKAMRNIPGVETANVSDLNILKLAPGGSIGRFVIWTESAFNKLNEMYAPGGKKGYTLPKPQMENADLARIINSTEVQSILRPKLDAPKKFAKKKNALKNKAEMAKLNPGSLKRRALRQKATQKGSKEYDLVQEKKKARTQASMEHNKKFKKGDETFYKTLMKAFESKAAEAAAARAAKPEASEAGDDE